jgi:tRNA dimethylallyltransferase
MSMDGITRISGRTLPGHASRERSASAVVVAIVGATTTGKSTMAMELAKVFGGEIICADSRTVHEELAIGAAKPTARDRQEVEHFGLDMVGLNSLCSGPEFAAMAASWVGAVHGRGHIPIVCGGTALFVESALYGVVFKAPEHGVAWIDEAPLEFVYKRFRDDGLALPLNWQDREILKRAWRRNRVERVGALRRPTLVLATSAPGEDEYRRRLERYAENRISQGLEEEVRSICARHGRTPTSLRSVGYMEWEEYFEGRVSLGEVARLIAEHGAAYGQRQERWVSRVPGVVRVAGIAEAIVEVQAFLDAMA